MQTLGGMLDDLKTQRFTSFEDWVNRATRCLAVRDLEAKGMPYVTPDDEDRAVCVDAKGRRCTMGKHFMRARDDGSFPISYIFPYQIKILVDSTKGIMP